MLATIRNRPRARYVGPAEKVKKRIEAIFG
jgi:hypothetical protein